jgi:N-acetyltransferase
LPHAKSESMNIRPVILEGKHVRLEPLLADHLDALCAAGANENTWRYLWFPIDTPENMEKFVSSALEDQASGIALPFATIEKTGGRVIGSTRFLAIDRPHRRVEIGGTWIAPDWQRTAINTEAKYLMLRHAFETWGCIRVELKTDSLNERSRAAIARIGAKEEGVFRNHMITWSGRLRHSVYFSMIQEEWPAAKARLEAMLNGRAEPRA